MKKLMIAAFAVAFAAVAQAATFKWTTAGLVAPNLDGSLSSISASAATGTWLATISLYDANMVALSDATGTSSSTVNTMTNAIQGTFGGVSFVYDNATVYHAVLTLNYTTDAGTQVLTTDPVATTLKNVGTTTINFSDAIAASSWSAASIPEPTSALMLLVGLAGLALKRKVA